jgi:hypothetical protein
VKGLTMRISQEDLAETREFLERMEYQAKNWRKGMRLKLITGAICMVLVGLGSFFLLLDEYRLSAQFAASTSDVTQEVLWARLQHVKFLSFAITLYMGLAVWGFWLFLTAESREKPKPIDAFLMRLARSYIAAGVSEKGNQP